MHVEPEARKIFAWQIHPAQVGIFSYVANDIGELKSDAGLLRQLFRTRIAIAKNADADQAHNRSDVVAVIVKLVEGLVLQLRNLAVGCCLRAGHIHRGPLHQLFQQIQLDVVPLLRISQANSTGSSVRSPAATRRNAFTHSSSFCRRCSCGSDGSSAMSSARRIKAYTAEIALRFWLGRTRNP